MKERISKFIASIPSSFFIVAIGILLFIPFLGNVHLFDWDEINFAEAAREMLISKNYTQVSINFEAFWEKPPLFIWMQAIAMSFFGINEMAARLPNAICGILTLVIIYKIGKQAFDKKFGVLWVLLYIGSMLPHMYFKSGIIDPFFNLFIFLGVYFLSKLSLDLEMYERKDRRSYKFKNIALSALFLGLAILTKGPVALLLVLISSMVFFVINKYKRIISFSEILIWLLIIFLVSSIWFGFEFYQRGPWFLKEFITYQIRLMRTEDAGHGGFLLYHFVVVLFGCFPAASLIFSAFKKKDMENGQQKNNRWWMIALLCTVMVVFTIVKTKIIHYSSLSYLPLTYLAALTLYYYLSDQIRLMKVEKFLFALTAVVWVALLVAVPFAGTHIELIKPLASKDIFAYHNLDAKVHWSYYDYLPATVALLSLLFFSLAIWMKRKNLAFIILLLGNAAAINMCITFFVPKIERYSQGSAIEFYERCAKEHASVEVFGHKSYAHLFYGKRTIQDKGLNFNVAIDRIGGNTCYFVCKLNKATYFETHYKVKRLYEKNGFVFFEKINQ